MPRNPKDVSWESLCAFSCPLLHVVLSAVCCQSLAVIVHRLCGYVLSC